MLKSVLIKIAEQKTQELFDKEWKDKNITNTSKCGLRKKKKKDLGKHTEFHYLHRWEAWAQNCVDRVDFGKVLHTVHQWVSLIVID